MVTADVAKKSDPPVRVKYLPRPVPAPTEPAQVIEAVPLDREIADMHQLFTLLQKYDESARSRMMAYVNARLDKEAN